MIALPAKGTEELRTHAMPIALSSLLIYKGMGANPEGHRGDDSPRSPEWAEDLQYSSRNRSWRSLT